MQVTLVPHFTESDLASITSLELKNATPKALKLKTNSKMPTSPLNFLMYPPVGFKLSAPCRQD